MKEKLKILHVEDSMHDAELVNRSLKKSRFDYEIKLVDTREAFSFHLDAFTPDLILSDHSLPTFSSLEALGIIKEKNLDIPFVLVTGTVSEEFAVNCMKAGVSDYILKTSLVRLPSSIETIFSTREMKKEKDEVKLLNDMLQKANREIEEKNKNITDSMRYAERIQKAVLPNPSELEEMFSESFIFFRPKDIVSGDFFWFESKGDCDYVAVGDCTGHGVPGALLSVLGVNILNSAFQHEPILSPAILLKNIDEMLNNLMSHRSKGRIMQDGMDISICEVNRKEMYMSFSGVNNSAYLIRKNKILELKPTRYSMGTGAVRDTFDVKTQELQKGDALYLFSDGLPDQFGGANGKKYGYKPFRELLLSIQNRPLIEQEIILDNTLNKWRGEEEQTDDILILGFRV